MIKKGEPTVTAEKHGDLTGAFGRVRNLVFADLLMALDDGNLKAAAVIRLEESCKIGPRGSGQFECSKDSRAFMRPLRLLNNRNIRLFQMGTSCGTMLMRQASPWVVCRPD